MKHFTLPKEGLLEENLPQGILHSREKSRLKSSMTR